MSLAKVFFENDNRAQREFGRDRDRAVARLIGLPFKENRRLDIESLKAFGDWSSGERAIIAFAVTLYNGRLGLELAEFYGIDDGILPALLYELDECEFDAALKLLRMHRRA